MGLEELFATGGSDSADSFREQGRGNIQEGHVREHSSMLLPSQNNPVSLPIERVACPTHPPAWISLYLHFDAHVRWTPTLIFQNSASAQL